MASATFIMISQKRKENAKQEKEEQYGKGICKTVILVVGHMQDKTLREKSLGM